MSSSYPDSVQFLYALGNEHKTIKLGLERISILLGALGDPHRSQRYVHVAGTNGKGSTCAMIERALREAGRRTGLYISPHLVEPCERIQVDGEPVSRGEFVAAFQAVQEKAGELVASRAIDNHPTYFETITAMAHWIFRERQVEVAVLETGMGGRLDATNVVDPLLSVITPIDFDHQQYLGDTIPKIAFEKAGILKPGRAAVFSRQRPEALAVLEKTAMERGCRVAHATSWRAERLEVSAYGSRFTATGPEAIDIECPLVGAHQVDNALTSIAALLELQIPTDAIQRGIAKTRWPGRLERVRRSPDIFLDGAHNPAGASALADYIREFHTGRRIWMIFGAMRDKDLSVIGPLLFPLASELIFTAPRQARAFQPEELRAASGEQRAHLLADPGEAVDTVQREAAPDDVIFITGSLYLVGEVRPRLVG